MRLNIALFLLFALVLWMPIIVEKTPLPRYIKPLNGAFEKADTIALSVKNWFNTAFQSNYQQIKKYNTRLRPEAIRLRNEIDYQLFNEFHAHYFTLGKDDYYFDVNWASSRAGTRKVTDEHLDTVLAKVKRLNDWCIENGKFFSVYLPPSKEEIFAEYLPDEFVKEGVENDYKSLIKYLDTYSINYEDLKHLMLEIMDTSSYPIYSKTSVHWTVYGAHFATELLTEQIEKTIKKEINHPKIEMLNIGKFRKSDGDHEKVLNLLSRVDQSDFAYPIYKAPNDSLYKPKIITIGDSYYWTMLSGYQFPNIFTDDSKYLYYYSTCYPTVGKPFPVKDLNMVDEIKSSDAILLLSCPHNLNNFPFGLELELDAILQELNDKGKNEKV